MSEKRLTDIMDFDHVIEVHPDGTVTDRNDILGPTLRGSELDSDQWFLLNGFSGQDRYAGPIMHASEYIGGGMERYIRETPGIYVSLVDWPDELDDEPDGWAVAVRKERNE